MLLVKFLVRGIFSGLSVLLGIYLLYLGFSNWSETEFKIISYGGKGKDIASMLFFAINFIMYGLWEGHNLASHKRNERAKVK